MRKILALDIATRTGWAYNREDGSVASGFLQLDSGCPKGGETVRHPYILLQARKAFVQLLMESGADVAVIEAGFQRGDDKLLHRLTGVGMLCAQEANAAVLTVTPGTWRKEIHGSGGLSTNEAKAAAKARTGIDQDDEAEARCILEYGHRTVVDAPAKKRRRLAA